MLCALLLIKSITFFGLKINLLFKSSIQRLATCDGSLLYGACTPLWWHYFVFKTLMLSVPFSSTWKSPSEGSLAWWDWTLYFPEGILFAKPSLKRWGLEQITWTEHWAQPSFWYTNRDCRNYHKAKMMNTRVCIKTKFLQGKQQLRNNLKLNPPGTWNWGAEDLPCAPQESEESLQAGVPVGCCLLWDASLCQGLWTFPHRHAQSWRLSPDQESISRACKQNTEQRDLHAK